VLTNTPPRSQQRSPGLMQANAIMEPVVAKAARQLGLDRCHPAHQFAGREGAVRAGGCGRRATSLALS
jgi:hypothetical protein